MPSAVSRQSSVVSRQLSGRQPSVPTRRGAPTEDDVDRHPRVGRGARADTQVRPYNIHARFMPATQVRPDSSGCALGIRPEDHYDPVTLPYGTGHELPA